jgi:hypothetical protein
MTIQFVKKAAVIFISVIAIKSNAQSVLNLENPPEQASLFGGNLINSSSSERDFALSPDGTEMFYTLQSPLQGSFQTILYRTRNAKGIWSKAEVAPFAGNYSDLEPVFTHDGKGLFFCSNRPISGTNIKDFDIWFVEKLNGKWGEPKNLGSPVNTDKDEFYPSVSAAGNLYFTAAYKNGIGKEDIYMARKNNDKYDEPVPLDTAVNSKTYEFNAFVSPDESFIIFSSFGRKDDLGGGDLYMSVKDNNGNWRPAKHLTVLNSNRIDYCPFVNSSKKILFFASERTALQNHFEKQVSFAELNKLYNAPLNGKGNIYWVGFERILLMYK